MNEILKIGQILHTESSQMPCQVEQFLGGGGQGEVYQANLGGQSVALKWYLPHAVRADPDWKQRSSLAHPTIDFYGRSIWYPSQVLTGLAILCPCESLSIKP
jgi:eukaryotic-like serine/threonine-protein kinase